MCNHRAMEKGYLDETNSNFQINFFSYSKKKLFCNTAFNSVITIHLHIIKSIPFNFDLVCVRTELFNGLDIKYMNCN